MDHSYLEYTQILKALADETRLKIVKLLSEGERCACQLLENFHVTQPTLSYHMKILCECGIVVSRREGAWMYYQNNSSVIEAVARFLSAIESNKASE